MAQIVDSRSNIVVAEVIGEGTPPSPPGDLTQLIGFAVVVAMMGMVMSLSSGMGEQ